MFYRGFLDHWLVLILRILHKSVEPIWLELITDLVLGRA